MKYRWTTVLVDLDGTLTDPGEGITNSVAHALRRFGLPVPPRPQLYKFIGPPLADSFQQYYGLSSEQARQGIAFYREYFRDRGIFENTVYQGIPALLAALKDAGCTVVMATSKPELFAQRIADHFGLTQYFDCIAGASMDETRVRKADVIEYALDRIGLQDRDAAVMVGDREHDVLGARQAGLRTIGVLYGYGSRAELEQAGAAAIAADVPSLRALLLPDETE